MGVIKNLKSLFIVEDESNPTPEKAKSGASPKGKKGVKPTNKTPRRSAKGAVNQKFVQILLKAMEEANLEGFDYLEYKQSLKSLSKMPMDEATRYKSAYAMAQTMGASPQMLIETAQHYLDALTQEEAKFEDALAGQKDKQIHAKEEEHQALQSIIKEKQTQIEVLQREIAQDQEKSSILLQEIKGAIGKIEATKLDFKATYASLAQQIQQDIDNMSTYLK